MNYKKFKVKVTIELKNPMSDIDFVDELAEWCEEHGYSFCGIVRGKK